MKEKNNLDKIISHRIEKLSRLREKGIDPYPHDANPSIAIDDLVKQFNKFIDSGDKIVVCGRIISSRDMGKTSFINIQGKTSVLQLYISEKEIGDDYSQLYKNTDIGDIMEAEGAIFKTKTGEFTLRVSRIKILSKSIRPLPNLKEKDGIQFDAFDDKEHRYRNRHLDFIANPEHKNIFVKRARIITSIRNFLDKMGFLEVETPVLQPIYGGANARPFTTFHNTLEQKLYLRIATELYLKRLIIGGFDKVYELSKDFRNEGMDRNHNPEFTMLEYYSSFSDIFDMLDLTESLIKSVAETADVNEIEFMDNKIDFTKVFNRVSMIDLFNENFSKWKDRTGSENVLFDIDTLHLIAKKNNLDVDADNYPKLVDKLFSTFIEPKLIQPTFVLDYPLELSPLSKLKRDSDLPVVERFELFIGGMEIANAFTELNDPQEQRSRMESQEKLKDKGDEEATEVDHDFINAMEVGMPPTGGVGIGIDRLVMLITGNKSIKDVILFPALRPENPK